MPVNSPWAPAAGVKVIRRGKVRRAKLYYLRDRVGKATRIKEDLKAGTEDRKREAARRSAAAAPPVEPAPAQAEQPKETANA